MGGGMNKEMEVSKQYSEDTMVRVEQKVDKIFEIVSQFKDEMIKKMIESDRIATQKFAEQDKAILSNKYKIILLSFVVAYAWLDTSKDITTKIFSLIGF